MPGKHKVKDGDTLSSIAAAMGVLPSSLWLDSENALLRSVRPNPNLLFRGDILVSPAKSLKVQSCTSDSTHLFRKKASMIWVRVQLIDALGDPLANLNGSVVVDGQVHQAATDGAGRFEKQVPACTKVVELIFDDEQTKLFVGHMDPIEQPEGVQRRLTNLGYRCGPIDGRIGSITTAAIAEFQQDNQLGITGQCDDGTQAQLVTLAGC